MTTLFYDDLPYDELVTDAMRNELLPRVKPNWSVLDLGISGGHAISPLAFAGLPITGVDTNLGALKFCQEEFGKAGIADRLTTAYMDAMQFLDTNTKKFNVVSMSDFLMFFKKTTAKSLIESAYGAVESGGLIWIVTKSTTDDLYSELSWMLPIEPDTYIIQAGCHGVSTVCFFQPGEVDEILQRLGATVLFSGESMNRVGGIVNTILARKE